MIIYVDIDETICRTPKDRDYNKSIPINHRIDKINRLYDEGNTVIYWTARGSGTGICWMELTKSQLQLWGAKYHELKMNKPIYDIFIDDKNINSDMFFSN